MQPYPWTPNEPQQGQPPTQPPEPEPAPIHRPLPEEPPHPPLPDEPTSPPERTRPGLQTAFERRVDGADLVETALEQRDGGLWVAGQCSKCFLRVAVLVSQAQAGVVRCPSGHLLDVPALRSARRPRPHATHEGFDMATLRGERDELHPAGHGDAAEAAPSLRIGVGTSQPNQSAWESKRPDIAPPKAGQPRVATAERSHSG